jgi:glycosidase
MIIAAGYIPIQYKFKLELGGTFRGLMDQLDYIQDLGFNAIWISPFPESSYHRVNEI